MSEVLSQDEIDQLLTAISSGVGDEIRENRSTKRIKIWDFKRPDKFSKENIRTISSLHDQLASNLTRAYSKTYDRTVRVHVASVDQLTFEEYVRSVPNPTLMANFKSNKKRLGPFAVEIDKLFVASLMFEEELVVTEEQLEEALKKREETSRRKINRNDKSEIEEVKKSLIESRFYKRIDDLKIELDKIKESKKLIKMTKDCIKKIYSKPFKVNSIEKIESFENPQFNSLSQPNEMGILVTLELAVSGDHVDKKNKEIISESMMNIFFPSESIEKSLKKLSKRLFSVYNTKKDRVHILFNEEELY